MLRPLCAGDADSPASHAWGGGAWKRGPDLGVEDTPLRLSGARPGPALSPPARACTPLQLVLPSWSSDKSLRSLAGFGVPVWGGSRWRSKRARAWSGESKGLAA